MLAVTHKVVPCPAHHAEVIHAAVLKETAIFNGQHALHQVVGDLVVGEQTALGAIHIVAQPGNEQRLKLIA